MLEERSQLGGATGRLIWSSACPKIVVYALDQSGVKFKPALQLYHAGANANHKLRPTTVANVAGIKNAIKMSTTMCINHLAISCLNRCEVAFLPNRRKARVVPGDIFAGRTVRLAVDGRDARCSCRQCEEQRSGTLLCVDCLPTDGSGCLLFEWRLRHVASLLPALQGETLCMVIHTRRPKQ